MAQQDAHQWVADDRALLTPGRASVARGMAIRLAWLAPFDSLRSLPSTRFRSLRAGRAGRRVGFQEAVTAVARVLDEPVSHGHGVDAMTEQPTGISDLLGEALAMSKPVRTGWS